MTRTPEPPKNCHACIYDDHAGTVHACAFSETDPDESAYFAVKAWADEHCDTPNNMPPADADDCPGFAPRTPVTSDGGEETAVTSTGLTFGAPLLAWDGTPLTVAQAASAAHVWSTTNGEILRFEEDGKVYVRGDLVDDNKAIYAAVVEFFDAWGAARRAEENAHLRSRLAHLEEEDAAEIEEAHVALDRLGIERVTDGVVRSIDGRLGVLSAKVRALEKVVETARAFVADERSTNMRRLQSALAALSGLARE